MTWRLPWTLGAALLLPCALATAQPQPSQAPDSPQRLRLNAQPPAPSPLDITPSPSSPRGPRGLASCPTCPGADGRPPASPATAPWRVGAFYTLGDPFTNVTFGLVGQRNERLPLFMAVPIGTPVGPAPAPWLSNTTSDSRIRWLATIAAQKTLLGKPGGPSLSVLGEAFLPLGTFGSKPAAVDATAPSGRAVRGALRVLF